MPFRLEELFFIFIALAAPVLIVAVPVWYLAGGGKNMGGKALERRYQGLDISSVPREGDVHILYHTYRGLLVWVNMDEHRVFARPDQARKLLGRLLRYNLTWGMLSQAMLFVPFLAIGNYIAQRRSIDQQQTKTINR